jgi:hypothetical protein
MNRRFVAACLTVTLPLSGCLSVHSTGSRTIEGGGGGVALVVWADDDARRAGTPGPAGVLGELDRNDGDHWVTIFRSINPAWVATGLPPGRYRVRLPARLDEGGNVVRLADSATEVRVAEGRITEVEAVLEHVDTGLVVAGVVAAVVAAVLISDYVSEHGLQAAGAAAGAARPGVLGDDRPGDRWAVAGGRRPRTASRDLALSGRGRAGRRAPPAAAVRVLGAACRRRPGAERRVSARRVGRPDPMCR